MELVWTGLGWAGQGWDGVRDQKAAMCDSREPQLSVRSEDSPSNEEVLGGL